MYERPMEAVELYKEGWAPRIYLFRQIADWGEAQLAERNFPYTREVDLQIDVMGRLGVPREAIGILDQANSTAEESDDVLALATGEKFSRVIVVTSKQHTRRARLVMNRRMNPAGVQVIVRSTRFDRSDVDRWWTNRSTLRFTLFETQRLLGILDRRDRLGGSEAPGSRPHRRCRSDRSRWARPALPTRWLVGGSAWVRTQPAPQARQRLDFARPGSGHRAPCTAVVNIISTARTRARYPTGRATLRLLLLRSIDPLNNRRWRPRSIARPTTRAHSMSCGVSPITITRSIASAGMS